MAREYIPIEVRRRVRARALHRCEYCQLPASHTSETFSVDHCVPAALGGESVESNLALSCSGCNLYKSTRLEAKDPVSGRTARIFNPRTDIWSEHFTWSDDELEVLGLTAIGRVTIQLLKMNRQPSLNLRELLKLGGLHPPDEA